MRRLGHLEDLRDVRYRLALAEQPAGLPAACTRSATAVPRGL